MSLSSPDEGVFCHAPAKLVVTPLSDCKTLLRRVYPYFLSHAIMERYAQIRYQLCRGQLIGDVDTLIAATALERSLTMVAIDSDFQRVPDLSVQLLTRQQLVS